MKPCVCRTPPRNGQHLFRKQIKGVSKKSKNWKTGTLSNTGVNCQQMNWQAGMLALRMCAKKQKTPRMLDSMTGPHRQTSHRQLQTQHITNIAPPQSRILIQAQHSCHSSQQQHSCHSSQQQRDAFLLFINEAHQPRVCQSRSLLFSQSA